MSLLTGPFLKYGAAALGVIALIAGAWWYIGRVRSEGFVAGKAATEVQVLTNTIVIERKIRDAEQSAPRTRRAVSDSLRAGTF